MADVQVLAPGVASAPLDYVVPGSQEIIVKALAATYDGNLAAGTFVPAVQVIAPGGKVVGTYLAVGQVSDFSAVDVSFGPFLVGLGDAIRFDVDNQGGYLDVTANTGDPSLGVGILLNDQSGGGVQIQAGGTGGVTLLTGAGGDVDIDASGGGNVNVQGEDVTVVSNGDTRITPAEFLVLASAFVAGGNNAVQVQTTTGNTFSHKDVSSGALLLQTSTNGIFGFLKAGKTFTLFDHNNNAILAVEEAGPSYRIKTGKAWVANL